MKVRLALVLFPMLLTACSWVAVTEAGRAVAVHGTVPDAACTRVGGVTASTRATIGGTPRGAAKIEEELDSLARNEAAGLGADVVVPATEIVAGRREYDAYRCSSAGA